MQRFRWTTITFVPTLAYLIPDGFVKLFFTNYFILLYLMYTAIIKRLYAHILYE